MDKKLFYCYLSYQKERDDSTWKRLMKIPCLAKIAFVGMIACLSLFFVPVFQKYPIVIAVIEVILAFILYFSTENFLIESSNKKLKEYQLYCREFVVWLNRQGIMSMETIKLLHERLNERIGEIREKRKENMSRFDRWVQILVIPIVLTIFSKIITEQNNIIEMMNAVLNILIVFWVVYAIAVACRCLGGFPEKRELEQMVYFSSDLQGVLDLYYVQEDKNKKLILHDEEECVSGNPKLAKKKSKKRK